MQVNRMMPTHGTAPAERVAAVAKRVIVIVALFAVVVCGWSLYRALFPVRAMELQVMSRNVAPGMPVFVQVVSSGSGPVDVRLELVQGTHAELLADLRVAPSRNALFDPKPRRGEMTPALTAEFLARFRAGPAELRATARGQSLWGHEPAPVIRDLPVLIVPPGT